MKKILVLLSLLLFFGNTITYAQFTTVGTTATLGNSCYRLTQAVAAQNGSIWSTNNLDLNQDFDLLFEVNLGNNNGGADGMVFVLSPTIPSPGTGGGGIGYMGMTNTIGVEIDTYHNGNYNDITSDHIAIISHGVTDHNAVTTLTTAVNASSTNINIEDGQNHDFRIKCDATLQTLEVYFDCVLRATYTGDIAMNQLNNNSIVKYGFTASTGALSNVQTVCIQGVSSGSSDSLEVCIGDTLNINPSLQSSNSTYTWSSNVTNVNADNSAEVYTLTNQVYTVTVANACSLVVDSFYVQPVTQLNASFPLPDSICIQDGNLTLIPFQTGGTFSGIGIIDSLGVFNTDSAGTGNFEITYSITGNCAASFSDSITVYSGIDATINDPGLMCEGDTINLSSINPGGVWLGNGILSSMNGTFSSGNNYGTYTVAHVYNQGCFSADTIDIIVHESYTPTLPNSISLCEGDSISIIGNDNLNANQFGTYDSWYSGLGVDSNGLFDGNVTGIGGPFYIYYNLAFEDGRCLGSDSIRVFVNNFTSSSFNTNDYCDNDNSFTNLFPVFPYGDWLIVSNNNSNTSWDPMGFVPSNVGPGTFVINYTVSDSATSTGCGSSSTDTIHIFQTPEAPNIGQDTFCFDTVIELEGLSDYDILWSSNQNMSDTLDSLQFYLDQMPSVGMNSLWLQAQNEICFSPIAQYNYFMYDSIRPSFTFATHSYNLPVDVTFTVSNPNSSLSYLWLINSFEEGLGEIFVKNFTTADYGEKNIQLIAYNEFGCTGVDLAVVELENSELISNIPNVFSPNGDGINDAFGIDGINGQPFIANAESYIVHIFNRWGNEIVQFNEDGYWSGEEHPDGVYFYIVNGTTFDDENFQLNGSITLIRE